ncbi:MAG: hypothetical protein HRF50_17930 [Phycisphaerae bacterium]|jgi:hypothetical protein
MTLESGPATKDRNYYLVMLLLCIAASLWFLKDGTHWPGYGAGGGWLKGYINKNREEARKKLTPLAAGKPVPAELGPAPTGDEFEKLKSQQGLTRDQLVRAWGEPFLRADGPGPGEVTEHFVSDYGKATVISKGGQIDPRRMAWMVWYKDKDEVDAQYLWALVPAAVALFALYRIYKAATLRAVIDDEGMTYGGRRIALDAMRSLRDYSPKGWVDLYYDEGGQERKLRIDNHKIARFDEIIDALCRAKGFADPRKIEETEEADEERGAAGG